jgi:hypothetical protein
MTRPLVNEASAFTRGREKKENTIRTLHYHTHWEAQAYEKNKGNYE